ncbi:MAG TPA: hypothetical protein VGK16_10210 [Candidatus Limnocylindrales bacterium]|jgi:hypothetical protein
MRSSRPGVAGALASAAGIVLLLPAVAVAASPSPTAAAGGDPRSSGQGPGLVGDPLWAIVIVAVIALLSILATIAYVRATHGRGDVPDR